MVTNNHLLMRKKWSFFLFPLSRWLATGRRQKWCWCCFRFFSLKKLLEHVKRNPFNWILLLLLPNPHTLLLPTTYLFFSPLLGIFFVLPCIESYQKVDLRTITLGVPPQEVRQKSFFVNLFFQSSYLLVRLLLLPLYTVTTTTTTTYYFNACILFSFSISSFPSSFQFILVYVVFY